MPLILGRSGCFHIAGWTGEATLAEAKKLSEDVSSFRASIARNTPVHGVCILSDLTKPPAKDARSYMDQETNILLGHLATINYLIVSQNPFRSAALMAVLSGTFLMKGVGGRISTFRDINKLVQHFEISGCYQLTTKTLLGGELDRVLREMQRAGLSPPPHNPSS